MTPTRPRSRWRASLNWLILTAIAFWGLGLLWNHLNKGLDPFMVVMSILGVFLALAGWWLDDRRGWGTWVFSLGVGLATLGTMHLLAVLGAVVALIAIVSVVGARRGLWCTLIVAVALSIGVVMDVARHPEFELVQQLPDLAIVITLLFLGWFVGRVVNRSEATADELWMAHRELEASAGLQQELLLAEERTRAAQELHDGLGHQLTLIKMSLEFARRTRETNPEAAWAEADHAAATSDQALQDMRAWVRAMSPPSAAGGVGPMLDSLAQSFRSTGLTVDVGYRGLEDEVSQAVGLFLRRAVQESLTNVLKHSNATHVRIDAVQDEDSLRIGIVDDGTSAEGTVAEGFGLRSLRERAMALGGACTATITPTGGFKVSAHVPLTEMGA